MKLKRLRAYFVDSSWGWFVVMAQTKIEAKHEGVMEFGRGKVRTVRLASDDEINYFKAVKGTFAL